MEIKVNNGTPIVLTGSVETFSQKVTLNPGSNTITVQAKDGERMSSIVTRTIQFNPIKTIAVDSDVFKIGGDNGTAIGSLQPGDITGCVNIANTSGQAISPVLVIALYNGEKLEKIKIGDNQTPIQNNTTALCSSTITVTGSVDNKNIKMFVWESMDSAKALTGTITMNQDVTAPTWMEGSTLEASNISSTSVTLEWTGASDNVGVSSYEVYKGATKVATVTGNTYTCSVTGLAANTSYTFSVQAVDDSYNISTSGPTVEVTTLPDPTALVFNFYVTSDSHVKNGLGDDKSNLFIYAVRDAVATNSKAFMMVGDVIESGEERDFNILMDLLDSVPNHPPAYGVVGNHEIRFKPGNMAQINDKLVRFYKNGTPDATYYDKWIEGYHFIVLNGERSLQNNAYITDTQFNWLREKMAENADANKPIFIFMHQPLSTMETAAMQNTLTSILTQYPQSVFISGHTHGSVSMSQTSAGYTTVNDGAVQNSRAALFNVYGDRVVLNSRTLGETSTNSVVGTIKGPTVTWVNNELTRTNTLKTGKSIGDGINQYPQWAKDYIDNAYSAAQAYIGGTTTQRGCGDTINMLVNAQNVFKKSQNLGQPPEYYTVSGRVLNELHQPVPGTTVNIYTYANQTTPAGTAVTGTDGSYTIAPELVSGKYVVKAPYYPGSISTVVIPFANVTNANISVDSAVLTDSTAPTWTAGTLAATNVKPTNLRLTWSGASDDTAVTAYKLYNGAEVIATVPASVGFYDITGLTANTSYTFTVKACDGSNNWSSVNNPTVTLVTPADTGAPTWPGGSLTVSAQTATTLTLNWTAATDDDTVTGYKVYNGTKLLATLDAFTTSYEVTGLTPETPYTFAVQAGDIANKWSTNGPTLTITLHDTVAPTWITPSWWTPPLCPETLLVASGATPTSVILKWLKPTNVTGAQDETGVTQYRIYNGTDLVATVAGNVNTYTVTGLTQGTTYTFTVQAGDAHGNWSTNGPTTTATPSLNLALGKATTSSNESGNSNRLVDGIVSFSNGWSSNTSGAIWAQIDLGASYQLNRIELEERPDYGFGTERVHFNIEASNDPAFGTYAILATVGFDGILDDSPFIIKVTNTTPYRYIRYRKTLNSVYSFISEIRAYGPGQ